MNIRQLQQFLTIADEGSIAGAAGALGATQTLLSRQLARLEKELGAELVQRGGQQVTLTPAGEILIRHARAIVRATARALELTGQAGGSPHGAASVGLPPSLGLFLSVPLAETIQNEFPDVRLRITEGMAGDIAEWVEDERLDLGYVYEVRDNNQLQFQPLLVEKLFFITAPDNMPDCVDFSDPTRPTIRSEALQSLPLVLPSFSHGARKQVERFARTAGFSLDIVVEIDSLPQIITMATRASAYTILPHAAVVDEVTAGTLRLVEVVRPTMTRTAYVLRKRSRPITRASQVVQQAVEVILREMIARFQLDATILK